MKAQDAIAAQIGNAVIQLAVVNEQMQQAQEQQANTLANLYECVVSGQVDEAGTAKLMKDPMFKAYYERRKS